LDWLSRHYDFVAMAHSIDELVLLDVTRGEKNTAEFSASVGALSSKCFMPIAAGGGISSLDDAYRILDAGADKLIVNTAIFENPELVVRMVKIFGGQSIVASIDYKRTKPQGEVFIRNGSRSTGQAVEDAVRHAERLGIGEIYLTSMERDGTGQGYDMEMLESVVGVCQVPIIASGGVGDFQHFVEGMHVANVTGASTANIFNFIGEGFLEARDHIRRNGIDLAAWNYEFLNDRDRL
jgi:cyclase